MRLETADYLVIIVYTILMAILGFVAKRKVKNMQDYFAGGKAVPWWMAAISHHMSGYSAFAFVGHASVAYMSGFSIWTFFAVPIFVAMILGSQLWAPKWVKLNVITPIEYLETRFNLKTRQVFAWSGISIKFIDEGVKLYSLAVIVHVVSGFPLEATIIACGFVTMFYIMFGGLWATMLTDFAQFIVQFVTSFILVYLVLQAVGGWTNMWESLPPGHSSLFSDAISPWFVLVYLFVIILSYNGGTWGLAQRFYSIGKPRDAKKAAILSACLYLIYPIAIYIPIWSARLVIGEIENPEHAYVLVAEKFLSQVSPGMLGLFISSIFAATMSMISSDLNSLAAVFTKDIYQRSINGNASEKKLIGIGMISTIVFGLLTIVSALITIQMQGAFNTMVEWYAAILGPISIPLLFGMIFRKPTWRGAIYSWAAGFITFIICKYGVPLIIGQATTFAFYTGMELLVSFSVFYFEGMINKQTPEEETRVNELFQKIK
ncbi:MAG: Na+:solute symporter [Bacteroidetes bacterium]|nr:Na+:solute symporter [Bacteroidota bacterium]MBU1116512.1 Na+:solute symporter [Bacteroidota bacterium]MBU1798769.1 Na+:solute symporter [Bacteroidota bacterium]